VLPDFGKSGAEAPAVVKASNDAAMVVLSLFMMFSSKGRDGLAECMKFYRHEDGASRNGGRNLARKDETGQKLAIVVTTSSWQ
jgi:hypothetical protein